MVKIAGNIVIFQGEREDSHPNISHPHVHQHVHR